MVTLLIDRPNNGPLAVARCSLECVGNGSFKTVTVTYSLLRSGRWVVDCLLDSTQRTFRNEPRVGFVNVIVKAGDISSLSITQCDDREPYSRLIFIPFFRLHVQWLGDPSYPS